MMAPGDMGFCFSFLPPVNSLAILCCTSYSVPDHRATLFLSEISVQHCGRIVGVVILSLAPNSDQSDGII